MRSGRLVWGRSLLASAVVVAVTIPGGSPVVAAPVAAGASAVREAVDEPSAVAAARRQGTEVEVGGLRDEYSQTFALPDGRFRMDRSLRPQRVRRSDGSWAAADATLQRNADGTISPVAATMQMAFSGGGGTPMAVMTSGGRSVKVFWPVALPAPVLSGSVATYRSVLPGVDLEIRAEVDSFTHLVVVRTAKAASNPALARLELRTELTGLSLQVDPVTDVVTAVDSSGGAVFGGPSPSMWDSRLTQPAPSDGLVGGQDKPGMVPAEPKRTRVDVEVAAGKLTLVPDAGMLSDPGTVWPVYVDPTWTPTSGSRNNWTILRASEPGRSFYNATSVGSNDATHGLVRAGRNDYEGPVYRDRSLFEMNVSAVRYKHIYRATFSLTQSWAGPGCGGAGGVVDLRELGYGFNSSTVWNTGWNTASSRPASGWWATLGSSSGVYRYGYSCGPRRVEFDSTWYVSALARIGRTNAFYGLRGRTETGNNEWKRYRLDPALSIWYNSVPNAPSSMSVDAKGCGAQAFPTWVTSTTPTLSARASDENTGQQDLQTRFYWWENGQSRSESNMVAQSTGNPAPVSAGVPAGRLVDNRTYAWQAVTRDDIGDEQWSGLCFFTVDASPPNPPRDVTSIDYPTSGAHGGVGIAGTFTFHPPVSNPSEVISYAYTLDSGVQAAQAPRVTASLVDRTASVVLRPRWDGVQTLRVWTVDAANRASTTSFSYVFTVSGGTGPAAHWDFDEPACGGDDDARHGNTLTVSGATCVAGRAGVGNALSIGASANAATAGPVTYPHPTTGVPVAVRTDASFTVAAWVRLPSAPNGSKAAVAADGNRTAPFWLGYELGANRWVFRFHHTDVDSPSASTVASDAIPVLGRWTHLAGVYDAQVNRLRLYVNGEPQAATAIPAGVFNATGPLRVGSMEYAGVLGHRWPGDIDDVRLYGFDLDSATIDDLADPLPPTITFPNGSSVPAGGQMTIRFDAGGDANVTSFAYSVAAETYDLSATPGTPGGQATVTVPVSAVGHTTVFVRAVDTTADRSVTRTASFEVLASITVSGTIRDAMTNAPVAGATVRLDPGDRSTSSAADGSYSFANVDAGTYTLAAAVGDRCAMFGATDVTVNRSLIVDLVLGGLSDAFGYTCRVETLAFIPADATVLPLTGDDVVTQVGLPFAVPWYDGSHTTAWVDSNGWLSFVDPGGSHPHDGVNIPMPSEPNAVVAPFWDDLVVDGSASVRTTVLGSEPDRRFVVEWRNVHRKGDTGQRVTFEVILGENGTMTFNYAGLDNLAERGEHAVVGIESPGGEIGIQYSYLEAVLASGTAVLFDFPGDPVAIERFDLSGVVTNPSGSPVAGTAVTLAPAEVTVTTGGDGRYTFAGLESGRYTTSVATGLRCGLYGSSELELMSDTSGANIALAGVSDEAGTTCSDGPLTFTPADGTVLPLTGDDEFTQISLPFPITFYGNTYGAAWVDTNGVVAFEQMFASAFDISEIPSLVGPASRPNAAVYPFWSDWNVDAAASVRTAVTGAAPSRQFIVEWRNVHAFNDPATRVTFEVVFQENGQVAFAYNDIGSTALEQGGSATVGVENADGTIALQYLHRETALSSGLGVVFQPGAPHTGTVTGTVVCNGAAAAGVQIAAAGQSATTTASGTYQLSGIEVGQYVVVATAGSGVCEGSTAAPVTVSKDAESSVDITMTSGAGYAATPGPRAFMPADGNVLPIAGDDEFGQISLPFPITLYGQSYTTGWVDTNGVVTFRQPTGPLWDVSAIPSAAAANRPNAAVYPFWNDWWVDASASIRTATTGTAPNRQFTVEWRNVHAFGDANQRVSFEVVFHEDGAIAFGYDIGSTFVAQGGNATVGVENDAGTVAVQYLHRHPALRTGDGVLLQPL